MYLAGNMAVYFVVRLAKPTGGGFQWVQGAWQPPLNHNTISLWLW